MNISDVAWDSDRHGRRILRLSIDGHRARIVPERQREVLLRRGIVEGIDTLASEWLRNLTARPFIGGPVPPELAGVPLAGCTDDPRVLALYEEMRAAIAAGTWQAGPRPAPPGTGELARTPVGAAAARTRPEADASPGRSIGGRAAVTGGPSHLLHHVSSGGGKS